jgi:multiple sugar transport system substrate-binding protein
MNTDKGVSLRKILLAILLAMLLLTLSCGRKASQKTTITFWHGLGGPLGDALTEMVREYNRTHPEYEVVLNQVSSYEALSQKLMASIQAGKQPDIAQVFESWTSKFIEADVIVPIEDLIKQDDKFEDKGLTDFYPVFVYSNTFNGKVWSFPFNKSVRMFFYNKDAFVRAGLNPDTFPADWNAFRTYCQTFTQDLDGDKQPDKFGTNFAPNAWQMINLLYQAGGTVIDDKGKVVINQKPGLEALTYITDLINKDKTVYIVSGYNGQNDFLAGKVAMYEGSSVSITHMKQQTINFNMGYAPLPTYKTNKSAISGSNVVVFRNADKAREMAAWEFIKWFTDTEQTARWSALTNYMPIRRSAMQSEAMQELLASHSQYQAVYAQLETAATEPQIPEWFEMRPELEKTIETALLKRRTPQQALDDFAKRLTDVIAANKK